MFKASIEYAKINKNFKIKFGIIIHSETDGKQPNLKLVNKFNYMGNEYLKIQPNPFLTFDISSFDDKKSEWSSNQSVNLNKRSLFVFLQALLTLLKQFKEIKSLFYYDEEKNLKVNIEDAQKITKVVILGNKRVLMQPCVVPDEQSSQIFYEGIIFCINGYDYFSYLSYAEMEYLYYELTHINMVELSLLLMNAVELHKDQEEITIQQKTISKVEEPEMPTKTYVKIEDPDTIPNI